MDAALTGTAVVMGDRKGLISHYLISLSLLIPLTRQEWLGGQKIFKGIKGIIPRRLTLFDPLCPRVTATSTSRRLPSLSEPLAPS